MQFQGYSLGMATFIGTPGNYELSPVPEPATVLGLCAGGTLLAGWVCRRVARRSV